MMLPLILYTGEFWLALGRQREPRDVQLAISRAYEVLWSKEYAFERDHAETFDLGEAGA